jgi:predicted GIY-YIG superfamily endonuclease
MTDRTALYRLYDADGHLLYVGVTGDPATRWHGHAHDKGWWPQVALRQVEWKATREEALAAEKEAIYTERPKYNVNHRYPRVSPESEALCARVREINETLAALRPEVRRLAVREMHSGATVGQLAEWTGLSREYFRRLAREAGIERRREPTVRRLSDDG